MRVSRRGWLRAAGAGGLWLVLSGHSPYRQWEVYRKTRLVLLTSAADPQSVQLGSALAKMYLQHLPESRATMARARDGNDLVRLLASRQLDIAVMREPDAHAALAGQAPYADSGGVRLRALAALGEHLFVCREEVPNGSAYMLIVRGPSSPFRYTQARQSITAITRSIVVRPLQALHRHSLILATDKPRIETVEFSNGEVQQRVC